MGAALAFVVASQALAASTPGSVTFADDQYGVSGAPGPGHTFDVVAAGTSTATGAINGTFDVVDEAVITGLGELHVDRVLDDGAGNTVTIDIEARFVASTATTETVLGHWNITGGTGSYLDVQGSGTYSATVYFTVAPHHIVGTLTGFAVYGAGS